MALNFDLAVGERISFSDGTSISLEHKSGTRARLRIEGADKKDVRLVKAPEVLRTMPLFKRNTTPK